MIQSVQWGCDSLGGKPEAVGPQLHSLLWNFGKCKWRFRAHLDFSVSEGTSVAGVRVLLISSDSSALRVRTVNKNNQDVEETMKTKLSCS